MASTGVLAIFCVANAARLTPLSNQNKSMNTIAIASRDAAEDSVREARALTRQMLHSPARVSAKPETNHVGSTVLPEVVASATSARYSSLCAIMPGNFMRTSNAYLGLETG